MPVIVEDVDQSRLFFFYFFYSSGGWVNRGRECLSTAKGCIKKLPWLGQVEQRNTKQTLHPAQSFRYYEEVESTQRSSVSLHGAELGVLPPRVPFFLRHSTSVRSRLFVWVGKRSRRHTVIATASSKQPQPTSLP